MIVLGLTGSIGMGKSTVGAMLQKLGVPVHDADGAVHESLQPGNKGYQGVAALFPLYMYPDIYSAKDKNGVRTINRGALGALVFDDARLRSDLESLLHPLVHESQQAFIKRYTALGLEMVALDIPLLFETGADRYVDYTLVASAPEHIQRQRVMKRKGMSAEKFAAICASQMPDGEKCSRADFVIPTGLGRAESMRALKAALRSIKDKQGGQSHEQQKDSTHPLSFRERRARDFSRYTD